MPVRKRMSILSSIIVAASLSLMGSASLATAAPDNDPYSEVRVKLVEAGAPEAQHGALITKLKQGVAWDSMTPGLHLSA